MAYVNLVNITCSDRGELFARMRDFLCKRNGTYDYSTTGIGYTLHDSSYAVDEDNPSSNDWFVIYSPGENGNEDLYFRVTLNASYITISGFLYWNNSTHAGVTQYYTSLGNFTVASTGTYALSVYGDLDRFAVVNYNGTYAYTCTAGKIKNSVDTVVTCSGSPVAGSDISITVSSIPSDWAVGRNIFIRDNANVDIITIKTLVGNVITADLSNSYATPKLSSYVGYYVQSGGVPHSDIYALIGHNNAKNQRITGVVNPLTTSGQTDPTVLNSEYVISSYYYAYTPGYVGWLTAIFKVDNTGLLNYDKLILTDGTEYRCLLIASNNMACVKEV